MKAFVRFLVILFALHVLLKLWHPDCGWVTLGKGGWDKHYGFFGYYTTRLRDQVTTGRINHGMLQTTAIATVVIVLLIIHEALHLACRFSLAGKTCPQSDKSNRPKRGRVMTSLPPICLSKAVGLCEIKNQPKPFARSRATAHLSIDCA